MVKKRLPKAIASAVIVSLYYGAKMKVRVGSELSKEFWVQIGVHQGSVLMPLVFAIAVKVIMTYTRDGLMNEILKMAFYKLVMKNVERRQKKTW